MLPYSFLSAALSPNMLSVRSYHAGATASAIDSGPEELLSAEQQGPSAIGQQNRLAEEGLQS